jgi:hypothetical protein
VDPRHRHNFFVRARHLAGNTPTVTSVALGSELQNVTRVRDAAVIAHRTVRTFSQLRTRGRLGAFLAAAAYPIEWLAYFGIICLQAGDTVHCGVASMIAPNPVDRPNRRLWSGVALATAVVIAVGALLSHVSSGVRFSLYGLGAICLVAWASELLVSWQPERRAGSLKSTEKLLHTMVDGPVVRGESFAAWPQRSGEFGPLLDAVVAELRRDGVTLVVEADNDALAQTYVHHGGVRPDPEQPRHIAWLAA